MVDGFDGATLFGWAKPAHSVVRLLYGGEELLTLPASAPRPDVAASGAGPLECGFRFPVDAILDAMMRLDDAGGPEPLRVAGPAGTFPGLASTPLTSDDVVSAAALGLARHHGA